MNFFGSDSDNQVTKLEESIYYVEEKLADFVTINPDISFSESSRINLDNIYSVPKMGIIDEEDLDEDLDEEELDEDFDDDFDEDEDLDEDDDFDEDFDEGDEEFEEEFVEEDFDSFDEDEEELEDEEVI